MAQVFDPIRLGRMELPNRLVMAPVKTTFCDYDGRMTERHAAFYARRSQGGVGAIVSEPFAVSQRGREHANQPLLDSDAAIEPLRRVVEAVHAAGDAKFIAHLNHAGAAADGAVGDGRTEAPSTIRRPYKGEPAEAMTQERIYQAIVDWSRAAWRAKLAGCDGIELQFGLGYLVNQFLSPATNRRTDEYGGWTDNRMRFSLELIEAIRTVIGPVLPIVLRITAEARPEDGQDADELHEMIRTWAAQEIDGLHVVSGSVSSSEPWYFNHMYRASSANLAQAAAVRELVDLPVIAAGRMGDPQTIVRALGEGVCDMVALGRPLLADPDLPHKLAVGREQEIMRCGQCRQGCLFGLRDGNGLHCMVNPELGMESLPLKPARVARKVAVVGGGPAGIQAAITAHDRGHQVTLIEKDSLGGAFAATHLKEDREALRRTFETFMDSLRRRGIEVHEHEVATADTLKALQPDLILLATGDLPENPIIPGLANAVSARDVLSGMPVGRRVLVLGGGLLGVEVADHLLARGHEVRLVEMLEDIAQDIEPARQKLVRKGLDGRPVTIHLKARLIRVENEEAILETAEGEHNIGPFDTYVFAGGTRPLLSLDHPSVSSQIALRVIGEAHRLEEVINAVLAGHEAALAIE